MTATKHKPLADAVPATATTSTPISPMTRTSVTLEVEGKPFLVALEAPEMFGSLSDFKRAMFTHVLAIANQMNAGSSALHAELGAEAEYLRLALTMNKRCAYIGSEVVIERSWTTRQPLAASHWMDFYRYNGAAGVQRVLRAFEMLLTERS
jgi:hypothetical protein